MAKAPATALAVGPKNAKREKMAQARFLLFWGRR
ncbi:hypothetical protein MAXJ12_00317 [Mesorhizobium alhagi CCNWXJ12-2]|jgi:hypothetical protein|uniref:Uncharacterized protein n=1 Tax=Mesorhizobium alhagi CCNWXJ12-2 TaxID=1107882 RepID=H0HIV9_9HYPH|nr:hypothetical protein MAXJ12_00317 [Mesorhizobium alhagi CCNWXJ12-2]